MHIFLNNRDQGVDIPQVKFVDREVLVKKAQRYVLKSERIFDESQNDTFKLLSTRT